MAKQTIGGVIRAALARGDDTAKILAEVRAAFPEAQTTSASVAWYRSQAKKAGNPSPAEKAPVKKATAEAVAQTVIQQASAPPVYHVGKFKATQGMEGPGFIVTLFRGSAPVARASDYGDGGPVFWEWFDPNSPALVKTVDWKDAPHSYKGTVEEALFAAYVMGLPKYVCRWSEDKTPHFQTPDLVVEEMVNDVILAKQLKRLLKKIVIVREGKMYTISGTPTPEAIQKYTKPGDMVLNTMPEAEALAVLKKFQG